MIEIIFTLAAAFYFYLFPEHLGWVQAALPTFIISLHIPRDPEL